MMNPNIHDRLKTARQKQTDHTIYPYSSSRDFNASNITSTAATPYMSGGNFSQLNLALGLNYGDSIVQSQHYQPENMTLPMVNSNLASQPSTSREPGDMVLSNFSGHILSDSNISQQALLPSFGNSDLVQTEDGLSKQRSDMSGNFPNIQLENGILFPIQYSSRSPFVGDKTDAFGNVSHFLNKPQSSSTNDDTQSQWNSDDFTNTSKSDLNINLVLQTDDTQHNSSLENRTSLGNIMSHYGSSNGYVSSNSYNISSSTLLTSNNVQQYNTETAGPKVTSGFSSPQTHGKDNTLSPFELSNYSGLRASAVTEVDQSASNLEQNQEPINAKSDFSPSQFFKALSEFMSRRNTSITQLPHIGSHVINLWALYSIVTKIGGMAQVNKEAAWPQVAKLLGFNDAEPNALMTLRNCYASLLYPFEQAYFSHKRNKAPIITGPEAVFTDFSFRKSSSLLQNFTASRDTLPGIGQDVASFVLHKSNQPPIVTTPSTSNCTVSTSPFNSKLSFHASDTQQYEPQPRSAIYKPQVRSVESYGGIDLQLFQQTVQQFHRPKLGDFGHIDIHALMMSIKSRLKMEMINALNILSILTVEHNGSLILAHCGELLEVLIDLLDDFLEKLNNLPILEEQNDGSYLLIYEASHMESCQIQENLKVDKEELNTFCQISCCVTNIIRNLSFVHENQGFIATHPRFINALISHLNTRSRKGINSYLLENRKNILVVFSNIGSMVPLGSQEATHLMIESLVDFLENASDTYSSLAMETLAKLTVPYENRAPICEVIFTHCDIFDVLLKYVPLNNLHSLTQEKRLVVAEMSILALQNICSIADIQTRRRIAEIPGLVLSLMRLTIKMSKRTLPTFDLFRPLCSKLLETLKILSAGNQDIFGYHLDRFVDLFTSNCLDTFVLSELIRLSSSQIRNI